MCRTRAIAVASSLLVVLRDGTRLISRAMATGLPSHVPPIPRGGSTAFKLTPASIPPNIYTPIVSLNSIGGGLVSPSGTIRIQPTVRLPPPPGARGGSILTHGCYRTSFGCSPRCVTCRTSADLNVVWGESTPLVVRLCTLVPASKYEGLHGIAPSPTRGQS